MALTEKLSFENVDVAKINQQLELQTRPKVSNRKDNKGKQDLQIIVK